VSRLRELQERLRRRKCASRNVDMVVPLADIGDAELRR
jgi:hypothetical protein